MSQNIIIVKAARDAEAGVWFVESSDVPGLRLEAETLEGLADQLPGAILDLLEASGKLSPEARFVRLIDVMSAGSCWRIAGQTTERH